MTRVGVLGCSAIAGRSVIPAIRATAGLELAALGSRSAAKAEDLAGRFGGAPCGYEDLLARDDVDAVYVSLPVGMHFEWGRRTLEAGKHLLMEKTFCETHDQAVRLVRAAAERGLVAMEALMYVYHPLQQRVRELVAGGAVGQVRHVDACFGFPPFREGDFRLDPALGGGASLDTLVYPLSFAIEMMGGAPEDASVVFQSEGRVDARGFVQLQRGGRIAQLAYGFGFAYRNEARVWGSAGALSIERAFTRTPDMAGEIAVRTQAGVRVVAVPAADHFALMVEHFARRVRGEAQPDVTEGERLLERMAAIERVRRLGLGGS